MNIVKLQKLVDEKASQRLKEALAYWLDFEPGEDEDGYALDDAWERVEEETEETVRDEESTTDVKKQARADLKEMRLILVDAGFYRAMTTKDIENTWSSRGRVWDFKINGTAYECVTSWQQWTNS